MESTIAVGVPLLLDITLLGLPFFDRGSRRNLRHRPFAIGSLVFLLGGSALLIGAAARDVQPASVAETAKPLNSAERAGRALFRGQCASCHVVGTEKGGDKGPELTDIGAHRSTAWMHSFVEDPLRFHPKSEMTGFGPPVLSHEAIEEVARYLSTLRGPRGHEVPLEVHDTFPDLQKSGAGDDRGASAKTDSSRKSAPPPIKLETKK